VVDGDEYVARGLVVSGNGVIGSVEEQEHYRSVRVTIGEKSEAEVDVMMVRGGNGF
jgi:hypothetical protein